MNKCIYCSGERRVCSLYTPNMYGGKAEVYIKRVPTPEHIKGRGAYYLCRCDCGNEKIILGHSLRTGNTKSCGCRLGKEWKNNAS